jgi:lipoprotein-anchoring transpeptidase ErfK/SrfK
MTDKPATARELLDQARSALQHNDQPTARRLARIAVGADPNFRDAWLLMADLSSGNARKAYLEQASRLSPDTIPTTVTPIFKDETHPNKKPTHPLPAVKPKRSFLFIILAAVILSGTILTVMLAWMFLPTGQTVSAADHSSYRQAGDLAKPTLTPTNTPEPTQTSTATFTPPPTQTATPEPILTNTPQAINLLPIPGIPENIIEGERWIDVDLTNQRTYAFEGSTLIRTFIVSTGTQYHPTVTGQYHIYVKYRYDDMAGPGYYLPDVPYTMYFYQGYSFHGTYWHDNFGVPMSHGCINMTIADSEWLYYWASIGTLVNIHY